MEPTQGPASSLPTPFDPGPAPPPPEIYQFKYRGEGTAFFFVIIKNIFLTIITLGIYAAWAKTRRRQYIWSHVELHGQRMVYTGTGMELFIGYLKLAGVYLVIFGVPMALGRVSRTAQLVVQGIVGLAVVFLIPYAIYWSRAYLLSRTSWRGIRFGLADNVRAYARTFIGGYFLTLLTLGIYGPFWLNNLRTVMTNSTRLGSERFAYDGRGNEVFWICFKGFWLTLVTLGIYWFWMQARLQRYYFSHTSYGGARGRFAITGGELFGLFILNAVATTMSFGLAFPWIATYSLRKILDRISFEGHIDFAQIFQRDGAASPTADGLADALGVDLGI